eukprot:6396391-Alexandrium_andersonii.AAC.1
MSASLVGSEMCIRDRPEAVPESGAGTGNGGPCTPASIGSADTPLIPQRPQRPSRECRGEEAVYDPDADNVELIQDSG